jgi:hypothetical protein
VYAASENKFYTSLKVSLLGCERQFVLGAVSKFCFRRKSVYLFVLIPLTDGEPPGPDLNSCSRHVGGSHRLSVEIYLCVFLFYRWGAARPRSQQLF